MSEEHEPEPEPATKKKPRKSAGASASAKAAGKKRSVSARDMDEDEDEEGAEDDFVDTRKLFKTAQSWENHVECIDTVERTPDGLFVYFTLWVAFDALPFSARPCSC